MLESVMDITAKELADLLRQTERAHKKHQQTFAARKEYHQQIPSDDWPTWYAKFMLAQLGKRKNY